MYSGKHATVCQNWVGTGMMPTARFFYYDTLRHVFKYMTAENLIDIRFVCIIPSTLSTSIHDTMPGTLPSSHAYPEILEYSTVG